MSQVTTNDDRAARVQNILQDVVARRSAGEALPNERVAAAHAELMPELGERLRELAIVERAREQADSTIASGAETRALSPSSGPPPDSFAGYEIVREIHRGGQGVVYQAIQKTTKRKVAIKVMHEGPFAGPRDRVRFEREVQILGTLKHPNIVSIHESGTSAGKFFYVMDYISGQPLDAYMAEGERSIEETLRLFTRICEAVNAAHLRGVIHRDLKPGNIRVDSSGEPHVLDFGLAKVALGEVNEASQLAIMTITGQFVGSLPWSSPEQAEGSPDKIDLRTDVYSLGVILYQMLTGRFPYEVVGSMRDVLDNILKAAPARPSTLDTRDSPKAKTAFGRWLLRSRTRVKGQQINDEVETIVLKCLAKERERRYQSAGELARDIRRYLAGEPIEAKRDSAVYVFRKLVRRYRVRLGIALAVVAVITGLGFYSWGRIAREQQARLLELERRLAAEHKERGALEMLAGVMLRLKRRADEPFELEAAQRLLTSTPDDTRTYAVVATIVSRLSHGGMRAREEILDGVLQRGRPAVAEFWDELANIKLQRRKWDEAASANDEFHRLSPDEPAYWCRESVIRLARGDYAGVEEVAFESLRRSPSSGAAWVALTTALQKQMRCDDVIVLLSAQAKRSAQDLSVLARDVQPRIQELSALLRLQHVPYSLEAQMLLARACCAHPDRLQTEYAMTLQLTPTFMPHEYDPTYLHRERVRDHPERLRELSRLTAFVVTEETTIGFEPCDSGGGVYALLALPSREDAGLTTSGLVHYRLGNLTEAIEVFAYLFEHSAGAAIDRFIYSLALSKSGRLAEAREQYQMGLDMLSRQAVADGESLSFRDESKAALGLP